MKEALIDTTSLRYFTRLNEEFAQYNPSFDIFRILPFLFRALHVPMEIKNEFANYSVRSTQASAVLDLIERGSSFLRLCTHYDPIVKASLDTAKIKGIDRGESEALAQAPTIQISFFITDDHRCSQAIATHYRHIHCVNSLTILAALDLNRIFTERDTIFTLFLRNYQKPGKSPKSGKKNTHGKKSGLSPLLRSAYEQAIFHYGIACNPKELSHLCSVKRLSL